MNEKDILQFKSNIESFSINDLLDMRTQLQTRFSQMVLDSDLVMKIAIVENQLQEKLKKEEKDGKIIDSEN